MKVFNQDGSISEMVGEPVYNPLSNLTVLDDLPDEYELMITKNGPNGRYVQLLPAQILRDLRIKQNASIAEVATIQSSMATIVTQLAARKEIVPLPNVVLTATELVSALTASKVFDKACTGIRTTDILLVTSSSMPAGYGIRAFQCTVNGTLNVTMQLPPLLSGGTPITLNVTALR